MKSRGLTPTLTLARDIVMMMRRLPRFKGKGRVEHFLEERLLRTPSVPVICNTLHGTLMEVDPTDPAVQEQIWRRGEYEPATTRLLKRILRPVDVFADVGSHIGYYACICAKILSNSGSVLAFEPYEPSFGRLCVNIRLNAASNVLPMMLALSDEAAGEVFLAPNPSMPEGGTGTTRVLSDSPKLDNSVRSCSTGTLDGLIAEGKIEEPTVIKIDVEGFELRVLWGASRLLRDRPPILVLEADDSLARRSGHTLAELAKFITTVNRYQLFVHSSGKSSQDPTLRRVQPWDVPQPDNLVCMVPDLHGDRNWLLQ